MSGHDQNLSPLNLDPKLLRYALGCLAVHRDQGYLTQRKIHDIVTLSPRFCHRMTPIYTYGKIKICPRDKYKG